MTRTLSVTAKVIAVALAIFAVYVLAFSVQADTRDASARDRGGSGSPSTDAPPGTTPTTNPGVGNISNSTNGTADSGGNEGGTVITGDEHVEVYVVNTGPTNTPDTDYGGNDGGDDPVPEPEPQCDRRALSDCPIQDAGRDR